MHIVAISDLHGYLPTDLPNGDVLVVAGDVCPDNVPQALWAQVKITEWLKKLQPQYNHIILTFGNHDFVGVYGEPVAGVIQDELNLVKPNSVHIVETPDVVNIDNHLFFVSPYCLTLKGWAYQTGEDSLAEMYRHIPIGVDVIVSHGPALDYRDKVESGEHVGSYALKKAINKAQPKVVICGHIHEQFGTYTKHHQGSSFPTVIYNVSQRDVDYKYHNRPVEITL